METNPSVLAHRFDISISGRELTENHLSYISRIVLEDNATGSDVLTFTIQDPKFTFITDDLFVEEAPVSFTGGWLHEGKKVNFQGFISAIDIDFPETGHPVMTIVCMDNSHLMHRKKEQKTWQDMKASDIAKEIGEKYGFEVVVDDSEKVHSSITQSGQSDIEFLTDLASKEEKDFYCKVKGNTLYFVVRNYLEEPQATKYYRQGPLDIISFRARITKEVIQDEIEKADIDVDTGETLEGIATDGTPRENQGEPIKNTYYRLTTEGSWDAFEGD